MSSASSRFVADVLVGNARRSTRKKSNFNPNPNPNPNPNSSVSQPQPQPESPSPSKKPKNPRNPSAYFDPRSAANWKLEFIANELGRILITEILANVFRTVIATTPRELLSTVYLLADRIAPPHEGLELRDWGCATY